MNEQEIYVFVGYKIREWRSIKNLTQEQLGEKLNMSRPSISNIEAGRHHISLHLLFRLAYILEIPPQELITK
ncbi:helix-turn-helix domain-containing protein [Paenibacillus sp. 481]|uniref:helix-turn-helix domain-containing protein n=1 Tax=Paenibacillus sp. 481 TaxID=2835869 RepID=UPI001E505893|nr:helix-turn-helix transcriptional regulator [Paenibacillus sp. 481]UHA73269.1 helix-turn-helix transcriptional regulator [Paenibacillus sp. 481]